MNSHLLYGYIIGTIITTLVLIYYIRYQYNGNTKLPGHIARVLLYSSTWFLTVPIMLMWFCHFYLEQQTNQIYVRWDKD